MFDLYSTATLLDVLRIQPAESSYWLDSFFGRTMNFTTEDIMFDKVVSQRRLAPFVSPVVQGRVMRKQGYQTLSFRPAYTKPKHVVDPNRQFSRLAGEGIGGSLTTAQRWNADLAPHLRTRRLRSLLGERCRAEAPDGQGYRPSVRLDALRDGIGRQAL
jgi:hypothetical protein